MTLEELAERYPVVAQLQARAAEAQARVAEEQARAADLQARNLSIRTRNAELRVQLRWLRNQIFGRKSEKRLFPDDARQMSLGETFEELLPQATETVKSYQRRTTKESAETGEVPEPLLRFDSTVPVQTIEILPDEVKDLPESAYEVVGEKVTHRLAQNPGAYFVVKYVRKVVKLKSEEIKCAPAPAAVLERSLADVSFLVGILIDKFLYHLPLYRQHQRLQASGVTLSRVTLTNYVHRTVELLSCIYYAQLSSILQSSVLLMDETPVKAGRAPTHGKLKQGWYWPLYGELDEVAFPFATSRAEKAAREVLGEYCGTLVTDGYKVYEKVVGTQETIRHAQCWVHTRRQFVKAEQLEPELVARALQFIGALYAVEERIKNLEPAEKLRLRIEQSGPVVDGFFSWLRSELATRLLLPSSLFTQAASYALSRERELRVFLHDPEVPLDTNQLERALRPIPMGRKNWLFCWTEVGAEYVGHIQSLLITCKLHGVDPYTYLVDVLQRIDSHPAKDVHLLTPRLWKENFAHNPLSSEAERLRKNATQ